MALRRHDVRPGATANLAHVHADAPLEVVQRVQLLHDVGKLQDRAGTGPRIETGMGALSRDAHVEMADAPPARLDPAFQAEGGLEDDDPGSLAGESDDVSRRLGTPDLFVRIDQQRRRDRRLPAQRVDRTEREHDLREPGLHVERPRSAKRTRRIVALDRHGLERAMWPYRVGVTDQDLKGRSLGANPRPREQLATGRASRDEGDLVPDLLQWPGQEILNTGLGLRVPRRGFHSSQILEVGEELLLPSLQELSHTARLRGRRQPTHRLKSAGNGNARVSETTA